MRARAFGRAPTGLPSPSVYVWLADTVLVLHLAFLAFIMFGGFLAWRWPRLIWAHLVCVAIGVVSITVGFDCPLTTWEQSLRRRGGQRAYTKGFVDHYLAGRVFPHGYAWAAQLVIATCVVVSWVGLVQRHRRSTSPYDKANGRPEAAATRQR
jgi:hypothetical protein